MAKTIHLDIVTPQGSVFSEDVEFFTFEAESGSMGILPGHAPLFTMLDMGVLEFKKDGQPDFVTTMGGFLEIHHDRAILLTESAEMADDIDELRAKAAEEKARAVLADKAGDVAVSKAESLADLKRASVRLRTVNLMNKRRGSGTRTTGHSRAGTDRLRM